MTGRVEGKVAFVTGAARGQGRSHAVRLAQEGANIIAVDLCEDFETVGYAMASEEDLKETVRLVEEAGQKIIAIKADVRERSQLKDAITSGIDVFGHLDIAVANAGIAAMASDKRDESMLLQSWVDGADTNFVGVINTIHAALPHVSDGGSLIATGSVAAFMNFTGDPNPGKDPGGASYTYAKKALSVFMYEIARQVAPKKIRANVVHPTNCDTNMLRSDPMYQAFRPDVENPTFDDAVLAFPAQQAFPVPYVEPLDISNAVLFLASDESRYVTGMNLRVDAGAYLKFNNFSV